MILSRFVHLPHFEDFFKSLKLALRTFGTSHNVKEYQHFARLVGIEGINSATMFSSLLNSGSGKDLKVRELLQILDNLDSESQKIVLDFLSQRYDFILSSSVDSSKSNFKDIKDLLLNLQINQSEITEAYINLFNDGIITPDEVKEVHNLTYILSAKLRELDYRLANEAKGK